MNGVREITDHQCPGCDHVRIAVLDEPGAGGASHLYDIYTKRGHGGYDADAALGFQRGPVRVNGVNGITDAALLAIVIDRLRGFQGGPNACHQNERALRHVEDGLCWLKQRAADRRGAEGKNGV